MPWEHTIINAEDRNKPLGKRDEVIACFTAALPGVILQPAPCPSAETMEQMPKILREHFMCKRQLNGEFEGSDFSLQLYAADQPLIKCVGAEVRGNDDPRSAFASLCLTNGRTVINNADDTILDFSNI